MFIRFIEDDVLAGIAHDFCKAYPFLKLCFYSAAAGKAPGTDVLQELPLDCAVEDHALFHGPGCIDISPGRKVSAVERDFMRKTGLKVRVFRREGGRWMRTSHRDRNTLEAENRKGGEALLCNGRAGEQV